MMGWEVRKADRFEPVYRIRKSWFARAICLTVLTQLACPTTSNAQVEVAFRSGSDLRDIAQTYLGDADLWPKILKENGLYEITSIQSGSILTIPVDAIAAARSAIAASLTKIQKANEIGAQVFAYEQIEAAIVQHDEALVAQKQGIWSEALAFAVAAGELASDAFSLAQKSRDQTTEARLSDRQGWVEGKRPEELGWDDRDLNATLVEEEKIRTLSRSTAQITFRDSGRLRLSANSHAVIQQMRVDPLKNRENAKVSLVEGDFYALLGGSPGRKALKVDVPDVNAEIDSGDFWVSQDKAGAKFTNYDDDKVEIAARGSSLSLGRNEGIVIRPGSAPAGKVDLLSAPVLLQPAIDQVVFNSVADLVWDPVDAAAGYWLEVARDPNFNQMTVSATGLVENVYLLEKLDLGDHFWRVAALDQFGLPGTRSLAQKFVMQVDNAPPFLRLDQPNSDKIYRNALVQVQGESEPGAKVAINGIAASVADTGAFSLSVTLVPGENRLDIAAKDPAGNETKIGLDIAHLPDADALLMFNQAMPRQSARHFFASGPELAVSGGTEPNSFLQIFDRDGTLRAEAATEANGQFAFLLPLKSEQEDFTVTIVTASGFASEDGFKVSQDMSAPEISLEMPLPRLTAVEWLPVRGQVTNAIRVMLNGRDIPIADDRFDEVVTLVDGPNTIEMSARDTVGNVVVESWQVILDQTPPAFVDHKINGAGTGRITIEVAAEDQNGLAKAAPFTLTAGGEQISGYLKYNKLSRSYKSVVGIASADAVILKTVELQDDAGNRTKVRIR
ncbi:MAG: FecR domain-containing protein [Hyphomicrobiales bacterium]